MSTSSHTTSVHDVAVGQRWRNKKSGIVATVTEIRGIGDRQQGHAVLSREKRPTTTKWLDLLVLDYELLPDEKDVAP